MSELRRLSEDASLPAFERAALRSAAGDEPSPAARIAARAALGIAAGTTVATMAPGAAAAATTTKIAAVSTLAKLAVVAVAVGTVAVAAPLVLRSSTPAQNSTAPAPTTPPRQMDKAGQSLPPVSAEETVMAVAVASLPDAPAASSSAPAPRVGGPVASPRSASPPLRLGDELPRLEEARAKLSAGDYAGTHAALDAYALEFKAGTLAPEAAALRVDAFVAAGERARATTAARAYLSRFPAGAAAPRMRDLISSDARDQNSTPAP